MLYQTQRQIGYFQSFIKIRLYLDKDLNLFLLLLLGSRNLENRFLIKKKQIIYFYYRSELIMSNNNRLIIGDYTVKLDEILGSGSFGNAYKCYKNNNKNVEYCMKIIQKTFNTDQKKEKNQKRQLEAEIQTFQQLKNEECENLVKMIDIIDQPSQLCIVMELCEYDLSKELNMIKESQTWLSRLEIVDLIKQILKGAIVLIRNHIIHRDIKPQNILVKIINKGQQNQRKIYKIADFGFTKYLDDVYAKANLTRVGTLVYCAPEILKGKEFSCKCDIYSYGILLHQITYEFTFPNNYVNQNQMKTFVLSIQDKPYQCPKLQGPYGDEICNLIERMLIYDQDKRLSFEELESHKIMTMPSPILKDSIFLPIERNYNQKDYQKEIQRNEQEKFSRLHLLIDIFYRKFLLCKWFIDFMKQTLVLNNIYFLILQQLVELIGFEQLNYGFAMINVIINDFEPTILNDNDIPQLIQLLNSYLNKSQENATYLNLHKNILQEYHKIKKTVEEDFNALILLKIQKDWNYNQDEFRLLNQAKTKKLSIQKCCQVLQEFTNQLVINDWISKCDKQTKERLETIKKIDTQFQIAHYRIINPDDIFKI
ncbi:unnamed protein product [Paramecium sonneborni]|uniref:Protein kinase domain-containing protein n=1 Tax=Paramecium sonneborni TaxID=65129 RepID=A0A8S1Q7F2_9CILI|nr:unnamed protein product [Paramecium sonneborni]